MAPSASSGTVIFVCHRQELLGVLYCLPAWHRHVLVVKFSSASSTSQRGRFRLRAWLIFNPAIIIDHERRQRQPGVVALVDCRDIQARHTCACAARAMQIVHHRNNQVYRKLVYWDVSDIFGLKLALTGGSGMSNKHAGQIFKSGFQTASCQNKATNIVNTTRASALDVNIAETGFHQARYESEACFIAVCARYRASSVRSSFLPRRLPETGRTQGRKTQGMPWFSAPTDKACPINSCLASAISSEAGYPGYHAASALSAKPGTAATLVPHRCWLAQSLHVYRRIVPALTILGCVNAPER